jgi:hypothetical protein
MTKLIVTPIDMSAPGSYRARKELLKAYAALQDAQKTTDIGPMLEAFDRLEKLVCEHAETDDGCTIAEALEQASAEDFDTLVGALLVGETVPNASSAS